MEIKKIINLTPHEINIMVGEKTMEIPPSGIIARCKEIITTFTPLEYPVSDIHGYPEVFPISLIRKELGEIEGLPEAEAGTIYIASLPIAQTAANQGRNDVLGIGESVRNEKGQIVGCTSLALF